MNFTSFYFLRSVVCFTFYFWTLDFKSVSDGNMLRSCFVWRWFAVFFSFFLSFSLSIKKCFWNSLLILIRWDDLKIDFTILILHGSQDETYFCYSKMKNKDFFLIKKLSLYRLHFLCSGTWVRIFNFLFSRPKRIT